MIKLTVEEPGEIVVLVFNDANTPQELERYFDEYFKLLEKYAKSSKHVFFKIDQLDMDGRWLDFATHWLNLRNTIQFVSLDEEILNTIVFPFGPEATFHKTIEDAMKAAK